MEFPQNETHLNLDAVALLRAKLLFHREQIKHHKKKELETKQAIEMIEGATQEVLETPTMNSETSFNFSASEIKAKTIDILKNNGSAMTTGEILTSIDPIFDTNEEMRKKGITSVSNALHSLVKNGLLETIEHMGRGKKYKYKKQTPALQGF